MIAQLPFPPPRRAARVRGGLVVDAFAGGGGASLGIERALGRHVDIAINHDEGAIEMHAANHPRTQHFRESVWTVDPREVCGSQPVSLLWLSPDCKHFSRAKGGKPVEKKIRALAWLAVRWAKAVRPRVICLENVSEFQTWGPLLEDDTPCPKRKGQTFRRFVSTLRATGYEVEWKVLNAAEYGAPTNRRRLFMVARCDGRPIEWPEPTHGPGRKPFRTAADCIDWTLPCPSIFDRARPLAPKTCRRIAAGIVRFVVNGKPFLVETGNGERVGQAPRIRSIDEPCWTVTGSGSQGGLVVPSLVSLRGTGPSHLHGESIEAPLRTVSAGGSHHALVSAFIAKHYGGVVGLPIRRPLGTVTAQDHHALVAATLVANNTNNAPRSVEDPLGTVTTGGRHFLVASFLTTYYSQGGTANAADAPMPTVVTRARHGLVTVDIDGETYVLTDIGMRMLQPRELARAQGFPDSYELTGTKSNQIARVGNSVCPAMSEAIVRANCAGARSRQAVVA